jgi:cytochrome c5
MVLILVTFFAAGMALGQLAPSVHFTIPYTFTIGSKALPAGTYTFSFSTDSSTITVESDKGGSATARVICGISGPNELFDGGYLVFDKTDSGLVLSEVWISGAGGKLLHPIPEGDSRLGLVGTRLNMKRSYSGKTVYGLTCARCHGDNGKGNPEADKFYGLTIPRLNSAVVQSMSDAKLRQQITLGGSAMPPVEIEESGFRHRLPPQDVEAVIAYIRTLKQ